MTIITKSGKPLLFEAESYKLRGMWIEIYNAIGPGHKESVYGNAFEKLLKEQKIEYKREPVLHIVFKNEIIGTYRPDFLVFNKIVVEFKSLIAVPEIFKKKLYQYLHSGKHKLGFLVNFGSTKLEITRKIFDKAL